ncbi:hypothetical protein [Streptomyces sp. NPDC048295]|uniref:hypothetical protein n=1 Tax=Streptomyces sp. NPDC048295 TaxID=3154617 RepID=UPI0034127758
MTAYVNVRALVPGHYVSPPSARALSPRICDGTPGLSGRPGARGRRRIGPGGRGLEIVRALGADLFVSRTALGKQVIAVLTW